MTTSHDERLAAAVAANRPAGVIAALQAGADPNGQHHYEETRDRECYAGRGRFAWGSTVSGGRILDARRRTGYGTGCTLSARRAVSARGAVDAVRTGRSFGWRLLGQQTLARVKRADNYAADEGAVGI